MQRRRRWRHVALGAGVRRVSVAASLASPQEVAILHVVGCRDPAHVLNLVENIEHVLVRLL